MHLVLGSHKKPESNSHVLGTQPSQLKKEGLRDKGLTKDGENLPVQRLS